MLGSNDFRSWCATVLAAVSCSPAFAADKDPLAPVAAGQWVFVGKDFQQGRGLNSDADGGCAISGAGTSSGTPGTWTGLALLGLAGAAMRLRRR